VKAILPVAAALAGSAAAAFAYATQVEPYWLQVVRRDVRLPGLPTALDGLTVLHLSDFHVRPGDSRANNVIAHAARLTADDIAVPKDRDESQMSTEIPITYVPARNTIFLSYALAWAEVLECDDVFLGVNALDYSGYPDCRPEFVESFQRTGRLGTKRTNFTVHAPLVHLTKAQIIRRGIELGVDYGLTHSCYDPDADGRACGRCDSCVLRQRGFAEAGVPDPTRYAG